MFSCVTIVHTPKQLKLPYMIVLYCVIVLFVGQQGDWHEGPDLGEWQTEGPEDFQEDVLLHHAG